MSGLLRATHDLSCALDELRRMARSETDLAVAAVAFTAQLAIDIGGCSVTEIRTLEAMLIAALRRTEPEPYRLGPLGSCRHCGLPMLRSATRICTVRRSRDNRNDHLPCESALAPDPDAGVRNPDDSR